jgi:imidazolonepropionase-like amidohydrolase/ketosteroid isomerase-like protein
VLCLPALRSQIGRVIRIGKAFQERVARARPAGRAARRRSAPALTACALLAGAAPAAGQIAAQPPLEVFHGFTLIDGSGGPPIQDAAISVRGNSIVTVGSRRELLSGPSAPRDAIVINLGGGWVMPGLVDGHVHLSTTPDRATSEAELHRLLYGGITAVRDMAGDARALASLARDSRLGEIEAPDVYFAAVMAGPRFMTDPRPRAASAGETAGEVPWIQAITPETDVAQAVARAKGTYATGIKIIAEVPAGQVASITREAHRQGLRVWAHSMVVPARPLEVIRADVDVISHACDLAWEAMAELPQRYDHDMRPRYGSFTADSPVFTQLFTEMRARGTILDPTLATYARAERLASTQAPTGGCDLSFARELVARARAEGVPIAAGSDFATPPDDPFPALYQELEELVAGGGLSSMDAIVAATSGSARAIGVEDTHGLLAHGRAVDFVLLRESPLEDIANLRSVAAVWKNAVRYDRTSYRSRFQPAEPTAPRPRLTPSGGAATPDALLEAWLGMWRRYDLDAVDELFVDDAAVSYFASDRQGLMEGVEAIRDYHAGLGFVADGFQPESELWLEQVTIADFGESAVIGAVWYFGSRLDRRAADRGPLTMVLTRTLSGLRISHVNFGNYAPER